MAKRTTAKSPPSSPSPAPAATLRTLADLVLDARNANRGTARGATLLNHSLKTRGAGRSVLADRKGGVIAGNKTVEQARALELPIRVVETTGEELVVVQRTDLDLAEDAVARELALADNRIAEVNLDWDPTLLDALQAEGVDFGNLWTPDELERVLGHGLHKGQADEDAEIPIAPTAIQLGDLFELGPHRVLCGDATVADHVARLLGEDRPNLLISDPPYGVGYDPAWRIEAGGRGRHAVGAVTNDDRVDWGAALAHFPGDVVYLWHAGVHGGEVAAMLTRGGFDIRAQIVWVKPHFVLGRGDYHWQHEPCYYAVRTGASSAWRGGRTHSTVWTVPHLNPFGGGHDAENAQTGHSTQKVVALYERPLLCHTDQGDLVLDLFLGSGTALIAAQKTGRHCRAMDLTPAYVQMAIDRWEAFTGQTARRHEVRLEP